jgi:hypothetical protein
MGPRERLMPDRVDCLVGVAAKRDNLFVTTASAARLYVVRFDPTAALVHIRRALGCNQALMPAHPFAVSWAANRGVRLCGHHPGAGSALGEVHARTVWRCLNVVIIRSYASALSGLLSISVLLVMPRARFKRPS